MPRLPPRAPPPRRLLKDFPVCLQLEGRAVLVVGAGTVATRRIRSLLRAGARVRVVAPEGSAGVASLEGAGRLEWRRRAFRRGDLRGVRVAFAATSDRKANRAVAEEAALRGVLVNAADDPAACDFTMPAVARRGTLSLAVSSGGTDPALAGRLGKRLARQLAAEAWAPRRKERG